MTQFIDIRNNNNNIIVNDNFINYVYTGQRQLSWENDYRGNGQHTIIKLRSYTELLAFYNRGDTPVQMYTTRLAVNGPMRRYYGIMGKQNTKVNANDILCFSFDIPGTSLPSREGLQVLNSDGRIIFDSQQKYMKIKKIIHQIYLDDEGNLALEDESGISIPPKCGIVFTHTPTYRIAYGDDGLAYEALALILNGHNTSIDEGPLQYADFWDVGEETYDDFTTMYTRDILAVDLSDYI